MGHSFHNTTSETLHRLRRYRDRALSQDERLLAYFMDAFNAEGRYVLLTPTAALERVFTKSVPITSVRRALSNLTRDGKLETSGKVMGPYGRPEHYWRLVEQNPQKDLF